MSSGDGMTADSACQLLRLTTDLRPLVADLLRVIRKCQSVDSFAHGVHQIEQVVQGRSTDRNLVVRASLSAALISQFVAESFDDNQGVRDGFLGGSHGRMIAQSCRVGLLGSA